MSQKNRGTLFLIPTPIGNLDDITLRALKTLKHVDLLLCEDTRHTQILLDHYEINVPKLSFHEHNSYSRVPEVIEKLEQGLDLGLVSDAGMPIISDPGIDLVEKLRKMEFDVVALPGANAAITALVGSGFPALPYTFLGFLPRNSNEIKNKLENIQGTTIIFYESPYRILKTLKLIEEIDDNWHICTARELTKIHEEYFQGTVKEVISHFSITAPKGEFVVILNPRVVELIAPSSDQWFSIINDEVEAGNPPNLAIKKFAKKYNLDRKTVYETYHKIGEHDESI